MKESTYNSFIPYKGKFLAFNAYNQKFMLLEPLLHDLIKAASNEGNIDGLESIHKDFYEALLMNGFIVEKHIDERKNLRELRESIDDNDSQYMLVINPTMNCNFKCWYCYESHIKGSKMTPETITKVKSHLDQVKENMPNLKSFHLSWFGGEPLLYFQQAIEPIARYAKSIFDDQIDFTMSFTTNGYLVNDKMIHELKKYKIESLQITLDGDKDQHNKIRYVNKTKGSYTKIVENIIRLVNNEVYVQVRINYTPENLSSIYGVLNDFQGISSEANKYIRFSFHKVWQADVDGVGEVEKIISAFRNAGLPTVSQYSNVDTVRNSCYADKKYQATINYNGEVHKCTARDFTSDRTEGILQDDGSIAWNEKFHQRMDSKFKNSPCNSCRIQPICNGGCSQVAMENAGKDYCVWEDQGISKDDIILSKFKQMVEMKVLREEAAAAEETTQKAIATA